MKHGSVVRFKATGTVGQFEAPPLHDPTGTQRGQGIVWIPRFGGDRFVYAYARELRLAQL